MYIPDRDQRCTDKRSAGFTLIEVVLFIVIVGVALGGLVAVLGDAMRSNADRVSQKQALAIAEAIVEEIALKPFTLCDLDDPGVTTGVCTLPENMGAESGETRATFDHVNDYASLGSLSSPVGDHSGTLNFPEGFDVSTISVVSEDFGGITGGDALRISVTVTGPGSTSITLDTYRTRYAPTLLD